MMIAGWLLGSWLIGSQLLAQSSSSSNSPDSGASSVSATADRAFWFSQKGAAVGRTQAAWSAPSKSGLLKHTAVWKKSTEAQRKFLICLLKEWETQVRFESAVAAMRLHYGIAACQMGLDLLSQADDAVQEQIGIENELIKLGGQVEDTTSLRSAKLELKDQRLELESKLSRLKDELSLLVGSELACSYIAELTCAPTNELLERCDYESLAIDRRIELRLLSDAYMNPELINEDALKVFSGLSGVPGGLGLISVPKVETGLFVHRATVDPNASLRQSLGRLLGARSDQIRIEAGIAYDTKEKCVERWRVAVKKSNLLTERLERLESLSELRGNLTQQIQAKLECYKAQGEEIQRWLEWHLADCDLQQATGRIGYWNLQPESCVSPSDAKLRDD
jgi:hypothetical protein